MDFQSEQRSQIFAEAPHQNTNEQKPFLPINETEARELGLEKFELPAHAAAQDLLARIYDPTRKDFFDVSTEVGQADFIAAWETLVPKLPFPCRVNKKDASKNDFVYLQKLQTKKVIANLDAVRPVPLLPHYDRPKTLWVQSWEEQNWDKNDALKKISAPLLHELGITKNGVVEAPRLVIDAALWLDGDPATKKKTACHAAVIKKLGLDPAQHQFRLITQDEYARIAVTRKDFYNHALCTHYHGYVLHDGDVEELFGGYIHGTGPTRVGSDPRDHNHDYVSVRLVLEKI